MNVFRTCRIDTKQYNLVQFGDRRIQPLLYKVGISSDSSCLEKMTSGNEVRCYDVERGICELLRSRSRMDEETVISLIKNYAAYKEKELNRLAAYVEKLNVNKVLKRYMEVLL